MSRVEWLPLSLVWEEVLEGLVFDEGGECEFCEFCLILSGKKGWDEEKGVLGGSEVVRFRESALLDKE